jgi:RNA helicase armi
MIVSTVRTEQKQLMKDNRFGLGFLQCPKRINVAISRARALLVIFGKQSILEKDANWKRVIEYTKNNNTFVTENY